MSAPHRIPSLDAIVCDPTLIRGLSPDTLEALAVRAAAVVGAVKAQLDIEKARVPAPALNGARTKAAPVPATISVEEACEQLKQPRRWLFRHASHLPFVIRLSRKRIVCDAGRLRDYLAAHEQP